MNDYEDVFPACAGMIRLYPPPRSGPTRVPRMRGDDPTALGPDGFRA